MNFNSKETYLAARAQWKADYQQLSADIRTARQAFRAAQREFSACDIAVEERYKTTEIAKTYNKVWIEVENTRRGRAILSAKATEMISDLIAMKEEANRQWEASRLVELT